MEARRVTAMTCVIGLVLITAIARSAMADCSPDPSRLTTVTFKAVFLAEASDLFGHRASFYWDPVDAVVIGPVDHDVWPGQRGAVAMPPKIAPGLGGSVTLAAWVIGSQPPIRGGQFRAFAPDYGATPPVQLLDDTATKIDDPFVIGLLAPTSVAAKAKLQRFASDRDKAAAAAHGLLYATRGEDSQRWLSSITPPIGDLRLGAARLDRLATLRDGGLAALAKLPPDPNKDDWSDYWPELAAAHLAGKDVTTVVDDVLLGHDTAAVAVDDIDNPMTRGCTAPRRQLRGPFVGRGELSSAVVRDLLRAKNAAFASRVERSFANAIAGAHHFVVATSATRAWLIGRSGDVAAIEVAKPLPLAATVSYVAHVSANPANASAVPHLAANVTAIPVAKMTRHTVGAVDPAATIALVKSSARSGNLSYLAGGAVALLFGLADQIAGWSIADARAFVWSLPGNVYSTPREWGATWSEILVHAIRVRLINGSQPRSSARCRRSSRSLSVNHTICAPRRCPPRW